MSEQLKTATSPHSWDVWWIHVSAWWWLGAQYAWDK